MPERGFPGAKRDREKTGELMVRELRFAIRMLLTPPPYQKPEQLMLVPTARTDGQKMDSPRGWAAKQWVDWQKESKSFQGIAAYDWTFNFLIRNDGSQSM